MKQQPDETWTEGNRGDDRDSEWAVILPGGDGTCLKSSTRKIAGDERPKQFCSVGRPNSTGGDTSARRA